MSLREDAARGTYVPPTLVVIGPITEFTFGSKASGSDTGPLKKNVSDRRLKRRIEPVSGALGRLAAIRTA